MRNLIEFIINVGIYTAQALKSISSAITSAYYTFLNAVQWLMLNITALIELWLKLFD